MDIQRLRNLTTGRLHTEMAHVYEDIEFIVGVKGIMTHCLPAAARAMEPYLVSQVPDPRYWGGRYDTSHTGEFDIRPMSDSERAEFWDRFQSA